jgi:hypothetical protein
MGATMVLLWPAEAQEIPQHGAAQKHCVSFTPSETAGCLRELYHCVWDPSAWEAHRIAWRSPLWQYEQLGRSRASAALRPWKLRAFAEGKPQKLLEAAAAACFWSLPRSFLAKLSRYVGAEPPQENGLLDILESLVVKILGLSPTEAVDVLALRMSNMEGRRHSAIEDFLEADSAFLCVSREEMADLQQEAQRASAKSPALSEYREAWVKRRNAVKPPDTVAASANGARKRGRGQSSAPKALPPGDLTQAQLRPLLPEGGFLWRGNKAGCWSSHYPPFPRCSRSWQLYGHRTAAIFVLRDVWERALTMQGKGTSA